MIDGVSPGVKWPLIILMVAAIASLGAPSVADERFVLEEIIVTVDRRRQDLQDFAGTAQAFDAADIAVRGVQSDFRNLQHVVPGLHITNQEGQIEVFIRGIGSTNNDFSSDPAVATHYNGVYLSRPRGIGPMFYDLERVEINKGPQGTLRGRNATGGTINILSRKPDFERFGGFLQIGAGNFSNRNFEGAVNIPLSEALGVRAAFYQEQHDPFYTNAFNNGVEAPGAIDDSAGRFSLLWEPNERFSIFVVYDRVKQEGSGDPGQFVGGALSAGFDTEELSDPYDQFFSQAGKMKNDIEGVATTLAYVFDDFILEYNGALRGYEFDNKNARRPFQTGAVYPGVDNSGTDFDNFGTFYQLENSDSVVYELRVLAPDDARFRWSVGGFYFREEYENVSWDIADKSLSQGSLGGESRGFDSEVESFALFADGTYDLSDRFRLKGGIRYSDEEKTQTGFQAQYTFDFGPGVSAEDVRVGTPGFKLMGPGERSLTNPLAADPAAFFLDGVERFGARDTLNDLIVADPEAVSLTTTAPQGVVTDKYEEDYIDWRLGVEVDLAEDHLAYATVSTGTRSGGINPRVTLQDGTILPTGFDPEELTVYEFGSKNAFTWQGSPVRFNAALFYYQYDGQVLQTLVSAAGSTAASQQNFLTNTNVGESTIWGIELDGGIGLPYGIEFNWNIAWLDSEFDDTRVVDSRINGQTVLINLEGNSLPNTSEWNLVFNLSQRREVNWADISSFDWTLNLTYRSEYYYTPFNSKGFNTSGNAIPLTDMGATLGCTTLQCDPGGAPLNGNFLSDKVDAFEVINLNAGLNLGAGEQFRIEAYVTNLTESAYTGKGFVNPFVNIRFLNPPRTAGVRVRVTF